MIEVVYIDNILNWARLCDTAGMIGTWKECGGEPA